MKKTCLNCGKSFECNSENITKCHCYSVKLSDNQLKQLKKDYNDCLCHDCLLKVVKSSEN